MWIRVFVTVAALAMSLVMAQSSIGATPGAVLQLMLRVLRTRDTSLIGIATTTETQNDGILWPNSQAVGFGGLSQNVMFTPESCVGMNSWGEAIIAYAAVKLQRETSFATSLGTAISTAFSPGGVTLENNGEALTYQMLLKHTSTITDSLFDAAIVQSPGTVGTLAAFVEAYFVTAGGTLNTAVFANAEPGATASYAHARANTALLAYILEQVIVTNGLAAGNLKTYLATNVFVPFGMHSTFFVNEDGTFPGVTPSPYFTGTFSIDYTDASVYSQYYEGCVADGFASARSLHPAWPADYMGYTTASDIGRFARALFVDTANSQESALMREQTVLSAASGTATLREGQVGQGLGLVYFNGDLVCSSATATTAISACPIDNSTAVIGNVGARGASIVGFLCVESSSEWICSSSAIVDSNSDASSTSSVFAIASAVFQDRFGSVTLDTPAPTDALRTESEDGVFGIKVFYSVFLSLFGCFVLTKLVQHFLLPASLSKVTNTNTFTVGPNQRLSPPRTGPLDGKMN